MENAIQLFGDAEWHADRFQRLPRFATQDRERRSSAKAPTLRQAPG